MTSHRRKSPAKSLELARVLLVDDDATSRLTLQAVLTACGYVVDAASSSAEALGKLDKGQYELVLSDIQKESPEAGLEVLAHANLMDYKPAIAVLTSYRKVSTDPPNAFTLVQPEDLPDLLGRVADLISKRAARMVEGQLRHA